MKLWISTLLLLAAVSHGCTYFEVPYKTTAGSKGGIVAGRAMELGDVIGDMQWHITVHPRTTKKLGYVSYDGLGVGGWKLLPKNYSTLVTEGMNEMGLSVSANTLRLSVYESGPTDKPKVSWWDVVTYLLENFGTVEEAIEGLRQVQVFTPPEVVCEEGACFHYSIADASGNSAVLEYIKGKLQVWDGRKEHVGIMTNDPSLDWQMTNLDQFVTLRPDWPTSNLDIQQHIASGDHPKVTGHGFNLKGLPADGSPPSRFVRMFYLREYAMMNYPEYGQSSEGGIKLATGLLNNAYLIKGTIAKKNALDAYEYSPWAVLKLPHERLMMYRTAYDLTWKQISLDSIDFGSVPKTSRMMPIEAVPIQDVTKQLMQSTQSSLLV